MDTKTEGAKPPEPPDGGRIDRVKTAVAKLIGITAVGGGGGTIGGLVTLLGDKSGESMLQSIRWGVLLGGLGGLMKLVHDYPITWLREWKADEYRQAKIEAERRAAAAEWRAAEAGRRAAEVIEQADRKVADCEARYELLNGRFDKLEADHDRMSKRLDDMRVGYDASIAKGEERYNASIAQAEERYGRLWERYERDRNKGLQVDQPPGATP